MPTAPPVFRFAPSPNGPLHLGHARSALLNARYAEQLGGRFLLRIEDIDPGRTREAFVTGIERDLTDLGLRWEQPVLRQSTRFRAYEAALEYLSAKGLVYPCFCTRTEIIAAAGKDGPLDPDGAPLYPGICRGLSGDERRARIAREPFALRIDMAAALAGVPPLSIRRWNLENGAVSDEPTDPARWGDAVLMRKDTPTSYHLAVVVDDGFQGVTHVVRGLDLEQATHLHRLLQHHLGLPTPLYHHHALIMGADGKKLSKSEGAVGLRAMLEGGASVAAIRAAALDGLVSQPPP